MNWKIITLILVFSLFICFIGANLVSAQPLNMKNTQGFLNDTATSAGVSGGETNLSLMIAGIIKMLLGLIGIVFVVLFIYGGFLYMTSAGNEDRVKKGKNLITSAVIGLIIIMTAYSIAYFVTTLIERSSAT